MYSCRTIDINVCFTFIVPSFDLACWIWITITWYQLYAFVIIPFCYRNSVIWIHSIPMTFPSFLFEIFFYWQWTIFGTVLKVAVTRYPFFFNAKHKGNVANQLSKNTLKFLIFGKVSSNFSTTYGLITFSFFILPLYRKKSYIIPDDPALTKKNNIFLVF